MPRADFLLCIWLSCLCILCSQSLLLPVATQRHRRSHPRASRGGAKEAAWPKAQQQQHQCQTRSAATRLFGAGDIKADSDSYTSWLTKKIEKSTRPKIGRVPRPRLDLKFAITLMRSSYQAADDLDFVAMDKFQKEFFFLRQDNWEDYKEAVPCQQGDLSSPDYFDFISFAQYATISELMKKGQTIFEEKVDAEGKVRTVQRPQKYPQENILLPAAHSRIVGNKILGFLHETFSKPVVKRLTPPSDDDFPLSDASPKNLAFLRDNIEDILDLFRLNFYSVGAKVQLDPGTKTFALELTAPPTLWSQQVLVHRKDSPVNDFEAKAVSAYLSQCGVAHKYTTRYEPLTVKHSFVLL